MVFRGKKGERRGSWALRARSEYNNQNEAHSQSRHGCMNLHSWLVVSGEDPFPGLTLWDNISPQLLKQGASHSSISLWACLQQISQVCVCACACVRTCVRACVRAHLVFSVSVLICVHTLHCSSSIPCFNPLQAVETTLRSKVAAPQ